MVDSCRQLTGFQSGGDEDTAGMVTILTGHSVEDMTDRSAAMKVCTVREGNVSPHRWGWRCVCRGGFIHGSSE